jgi:glycyl-tRNA synthetase beta chain
MTNLESRDPAQVRAGNERVIRPRFSDAEFFWNQDRKQPLAARRKASSTSFSSNGWARLPTRASESRRWPGLSRRKVMDNRTGRIGRRGWPNAI